MPTLPSTSPAHGTCLMSRRPCGRMPHPCRSSRLSCRMSLAARAVSLRQTRSSAKRLAGAASRRRGIPRVVAVASASSSNAGSMAFALSCRRGRSASLHQQSSSSGGGSGSLRMHGSPLHGSLVRVSMPYGFSKTGYGAVGCTYFLSKFISENVILKPFAKAF